MTLPRYLHVTLKCDAASGLLAPGRAATRRCTQHHDHVTRRLASIQRPNGGEELKYAARLVVLVVFTMMLLRVIPLD